MFALLLSTAYASSQEPVCNIEISPSRLAGPGTVDVTITVSNPGSEDMTSPVTLYYPDAKPVSEFGTDGKTTLKAGETSTWTGKYEVSQKTLDIGEIKFYLKYTTTRSNGQEIAQSMPIRGKVSIQTQEPAIEVSRTITPTVAKEGDSVLIHYEIKNVGGIDLINMTLEESDDIHPKKQKIADTLPVGGTANVKFTVKMGKKNLTSNSTINYKAKGSTKTLKYTVENKEIVYGEPKLEATLSSAQKGVPINEKIVLSLTLDNEGETDFSDIRVTNPILGDVFSNQTLMAGKEVVLEKEITLTETTTYEFTVHAVDSNGLAMEVVTNALTLNAVDPKDVLSLDLSLTADRTIIYQTPGKVRFRLVIHNISNVDAHDVDVNHGSTDIYTFDTIPAGASRTLTRDVAISMAGKYQFSAVAKDPIEISSNFKSNELQIAFEVPTPPPSTPTPAPIPTPEPVFVAEVMPSIYDASVAPLPKLIQRILFPLLISLAVLFVISLALLVISPVRKWLHKKNVLAEFTPKKFRDYVVEPPTEPVVPASSETSSISPDMEGELVQDASTEPSILDESSESANSSSSPFKAPSSMSQGFYDEEFSNLSSEPTPIDYSYGERESRLSSYDTPPLEDTTTPPTYDYDDSPSDYYSEDDYVQYDEYYDESTIYEGDDASDATPTNISEPPYGRIGRRKRR